MRRLPLFNSRQLKGLRFSTQAATEKSTEEKAAEIGTEVMPWFKRYAILVVPASIVAAGSFLIINIPALRYFVEEIRPEPVIFLREHYGFSGENLEERNRIKNTRREQGRKVSVRVKRPDGELLVLRDVDPTQPYSTLLLSSGATQNGIAHGIEFLDGEEGASDNLGEQCLSVEYRGSFSDGSSSGHRSSDGNNSSSRWAGTEAYWPSLWQRASAPPNRSLAHSDGTLSSSESSAYSLTLPQEYSYFARRVLLDRRFSAFAEFMVSRIRRYDDMKAGAMSPASGSSSNASGHLHAFRQSAVIWENMFGASSGSSQANESSSSGLGLGWMGLGLGTPTNASDFAATSSMSRIQAVEAIDSLALEIASLEVEKVGGVREIDAIEADIASLQQRITALRRKYINRFYYF